MAIPLVQEPKILSWELMNEIAASRSESVVEFLGKCNLGELKLTNSPPVDDQLFQQILEKIRNHKQLEKLSLRKTHVETVALKEFLNFSRLKISHCNHLVAIEITECHSLTKLTLKNLRALVTLTIFKCWFLEVIDLDDKRFPSLQNLSVKECTLLKSLNISDLSTLKIVSVYNNGTAILLCNKNVLGNSPKQSPKE